MSADNRCVSGTLRATESFAFTDTADTVSGMRAIVEFTVVPVSLLQDSRLGRPGRIEQRSLQGELSSGQANAVQALTRRDSSNGVLLTCRSRNPALTEAVPPKTFARNATTGIDCLHHTHRKTEAGTDEFAWVVDGLSEADTRQFGKWLTLFILVTCWAEENGHDVDRVTYDGTIVRPDGTCVSSPYRLTDIVFEDVVDRPSLTCYPA
jgi:hypothetical protein